MEDAQNHPIPQDVTRFQFKIIGDMTVKQFAYLASASVAAWIFYELPISSFIKLPLACLTAGLGAALAFLPIGGRPVDVMLANFVKALFRPTQFIYGKTGGTLLLSADTASQKLKKQKEGKLGSSLAGKSLSELLDTQPKLPKNKLDAKELTFFNYLSKLFSENSLLPQSQSSSSGLYYSQSSPRQQSSTPPVISMVSPVPSEEVLEKPNPEALEKIQEEDEGLKRKISALEKDLEIAKGEKTTLQQRQFAPTAPPQRALDLERQLQEVLAQKAQLTKQLVTLQQKLDLHKKNVFTPTMATASSTNETAKMQTQNVRQIPKGMGKSIGLPISPEVPNLLTGIIKDPRGNPLTNILVEVKDNEGNPVRAFKTNGLGQFVSATPLANGVYTIEFEDPKGQNKFDAIEFKAEGKIILPIEVISVDTREELRKSLFSTN